MSNAREQAIEAGCNAYICKPILADDLKEIVKMQLSEIFNRTSN